MSLAISHRYLARVLTLTSLALLAGCGGGGRGAGDAGGAATGDDLGSSAAGSARSNDSVQGGRPINDTLPGRDSRPRQPAGISDSTRRP